MLRLFTALLILIAAVAGALYISHEGGYILFSLGPWRIEMNLVVFLTLLALAGFVLYLLLATLGRIVSLPRRLKRWRHQRKLARARNDLSHGLLELAEGDYEVAERQLTRSAARSEAPLVNYLAAAIAAQRRGAREMRDHYLAIAEQGGRQARTAVRLLQAQLQTDGGQWEEAQATLTDLLEREPDHRRILELMVACCTALGDWERLEHLLPRLRRHRVVSEEQLTELNRWVARERLTYAASRGPGSLERTWKELPRALRGDDDALGTYIDGLLLHGQYKAAEALLRRRLQKSWNDSMLRRYAALPAAAGGNRLSQVETWLKERPENPVLLYLAGILALRERLWGRARSYLEAAVARSAQPEYFRALGALQEHLGEQDAAKASYRHALDLAAPGEPLPELPEPRTTKSPVDDETAISVAETYQAHNEDPSTDAGPAR